MSIARKLLATGLLGVLGTAAITSGDAFAQQIYRIVGPDGRVTFSDQPPPAGASNVKAAPVVTMQGGGSVENAGLPAELRTVANKYPVTLYSGPNCDPCTSGRAMLSGRGIPFTEKLIATPQDFDAFKRLHGSPSLPLLTIGGQQLKGYSDVEWAQYLDAAGYPKTSMLPPNYRQGPATPMVAVQEVPATPVDSATASNPAAPALPPAAPADNPAGIKF